MTAIRMVMTQEVDATPEQVRAALTAWKDRNNEIQFPHEPGAFVRLSPDLAAALGVHAEAPAIVLGRAEGCAIGVVGFVTSNGAIAPMAVQPGQVRPAVDDLEVEPAQ